MRMHRSVFGEVDFAAYQAVTELARIDLERLHIASYLLIAALIDNFEHAIGRPVLGRMDKHDKVRRPCQRYRLRGRC